MASRSKAPLARTQDPEITDPAVAAVFAAQPAALREKLLALRHLILETAAQTEGIGGLEEALKWGQVSYLTAATKAGSTIRIGPLKGPPDRLALFVHCQTNLIETFRRHYPETLVYDGKRAVVFGVEQALPEAELRHCIALALTYHLRKKTDRKTKIVRTA